MAYNKNPTFGIAIDWETSGSEWGGDSTKSCQGISMGLVIYKTSNFEIVDTLYLEIKFDASKYKWSTDAEKIHKLSREHLAANGITQEEAAVELMNKLVQYFDPSEDILFMGHNVDFDIGFTKQLLEPFSLMFNISHRRLDTAGTAYIVLGIHRSEDLFTFLGMPERQMHNALEDAIYTVMACERMRLLMNSALGI
jgi:DNA polymerase III epsilon subunit-like protein